jgi:phage replication-related protein YjqB (UPF0714/DUF867 family)
MVCEYIKNDVYNSTTPETENSYIVSMMFDPTEPTHLYTSYGASSVITMQDVSKPESEEIIYAGHLNVRADNTSTTQVINGYRTELEQPNDHYSRRIWTKKHVHCRCRNPDHTQN